MRQSVKRWASAAALFIVLAATACASESRAEEQKSYTGKVFLGLGTKEVKLEADARHKSTIGLKVTFVAALSTAEKAGIRVGDIIVSIDGEFWTAENVSRSRSFGKVGDKSRPGGQAAFSLLRANEKNPAGPKDILTINALLLPCPFTVPEQPQTPSNDMLRPDLKDFHPDYETLCRTLIRASGFEADCADLQRRLNECEEFPDPHRLPICRYVHRAPFKLEKISREVTDPIVARPGLGVAEARFILDHLEQQLLYFDRRKAQPEEFKPPQLPDYAGKDLNQHLVFVEAFLKLAAECHKDAFKALNEEDVQYIIEHREAMLDAFIEVKMLSYDVNAARQRNYMKILELATKVDIAALIRQAKLLTFITSPQFTASLLKAARDSKANLDGAHIAARNTPYGEILVAGRARNRYAGKQDYAAIFDLGGDDVYANNQASSVWGKIPSAVIVDYDGNDAYETFEPFTQGCGNLGVGILVDLKGDDSYVGKRFTQGVGFMGVGMLFDEEGNDVYRGIEFHQGVGHWGVGVLCDRQGADRYEVHTVAQGVGLPGGCGLLCDGGNGADSYYCKGSQPSGYMDAGCFEGWGQGMGMGYRPYASGGLGILFDEGGPDRMEAGNFSQGGGYFYGFGTLYNGGADSDTYIGSRYAQGFGCHQAAGAFIEKGGNDRYQTRLNVVQGLAWDEAVALFLDEAGDDRYEGGGFSHGASAMNGWVFFIDRAGKDTYLYTDQGLTSGNSYHGGTSLSFFADVGGQEDSYPSRKNNSIQKGGERSLFLDLPGSFENALKNEAWKGLMVEEAVKK